MIQVSSAAWTALNSDRFVLRMRVIWRLTRSTGGVDVTERVLSISPISRAIGSFLSGYTGSDCMITLDNSDGVFTVGEAASYLRWGGRAFLNTEVEITEGVRLPDGTFEYIPVFLGRVNYAVTRPGVIEIKVVDKFTMAALMPMPEDFAFKEVSATASPGPGMNVALGILTQFTDLTAGDVIDQDGGFFFNENGWRLEGRVLQGSSVGAAAVEIARSMLHTLVSVETGEVAVVSELMPRKMNEDMIDSGRYPDIIDASKAGSFSMVTPMALHCSEVNVEFGGGARATSYRATADEYEGVGRVVRTVRMRFCPLGSMAAYAARVIYEHHRDFPTAFAMNSWPLGLLLQLNDRVKVKFPDKSTASDCYVVGKRWSPQGVGLSMMTNPAEQTIHEGDFAVYGVDSWGDTIL